MNILFVCSRNKWRSRTAEELYKNHGQHNVRSAGTDNNARIKIDARLMNWADLILVMEEKHKKKLYTSFPEIVRTKSVEVLGIADEYKFMDPELEEILNISVEPYIQL